jgi:hypothetical protein
MIAPNNMLPQLHPANAYKRQLNTMTHTAEVEPTFDQWWSIYNYKLDRKRCLKLWGKMSQQNREAAMEHTQRYVASTFTDGRFPSRRHPGTYLHNENWHDEALIRPLQPALKSQDEYERQAIEYLRQSIEGSNP